MKRSLGSIILGSACMLGIFAQSVMWETLIPFESDDDGPVGIDITDTGEILVAYYTNGPNESIWEGDSLTHSPITKVVTLNASGDLINTEDHGQLFNHDVSGIGRTENGYSLSGNNERPSSAMLINFSETGRDTIEFASEGYVNSIGSIKTSGSHKPLALLTEYGIAPGSGTELSVVDLKGDSLITLDDIAIPDSISQDYHSFYVLDIDMSIDNKMLVTGVFAAIIPYEEHLVYSSSMDVNYNELWGIYIQNSYYSDGHFRSVSFTPEGGCLAGFYYGGNDNDIMKYNSNGEFEYSLGSYAGNYIELIRYIGNNEYLFKIKDSDIIYKIIDTGTELIEEWSIVLEGIKVVRAVENGFIAAGVKEGNISIKGFDATTGIEDTSGVPSVTALYQNYPNPFNPVTQIKFALAKTADVKLSVYNISGQLVSELASGVMNAGQHAVDFDGSRLNSGIYYYMLEVDGKNMTKRMLMIK